MMGMGMGMRRVVDDLGHRLLTLDGPTVYFQTNLGAVAALDAETGRDPLGRHLSQAGPRRAGAGPQRDLNPAIVHDGLVIVAPDDAASIYAFDAGSGRLAWKTDPLPEEVKLAHLLGVAKGRLVATGDRVSSFDVKTGKLLHTWPDGRPAFEGFGRGLLAGDQIYWPTRTEIHVLDQATGPARPSPPIKLQETFQTTGGNLAVGDGYLIVAQADALVVFCQNSRLIQRYRDEIAAGPRPGRELLTGWRRRPRRPGSDELALESLGEAVARGAALRDRSTAWPLVDAARDHQFRLLMKLGRKARPAKDWDRAAAPLRGGRPRPRGRTAIASPPGCVLAEVQLDRGDRARRGRHAASACSPTSGSAC